MTGRFASAVTTAPRNVDYLASTLRSLDEAGFGNPIVIVDGPTDEFHHQRTASAGARLGIVPTFRIALSHLVGRADWVIVFQDDILVAKGLADWLPDNLPGDGVVSLYTSAAHDSPNGWNQMDLMPTDDNPQPWHRSLGACALAMPSQIARMYLGGDPPLRTDRLGASVGEFCYRFGIDFWTHSPSLVQHIGKESCRNGAPITVERQAARFCADVRSLGGPAELEATWKHPGHCRELAAGFVCH